MKHLFDDKPDPSISYACIEEIELVGLSHLTFATKVLPSGLRELQICMEVNSEYTIYSNVVETDFKSAANLFECFRALFVKLSLAENGGS